MEINYLIENFKILDEAIKKIGNSEIEENIRRLEAKRYRREQQEDQSDERDFIRQAQQDKAERIAAERRLD